MKPILFSAEMVRAIQDLRKTQTRRVAKFLGNRNPNWTGYIKDGLQLYNGTNEPCLKKPFYQADDILWVRETWLKADDGYYYKADIEVPSESEDLRKAYGYKWKPSIFMPREAARIFLKVTNVRVERVQDITEEDAIAEGIRIGIGGEPYFSCRDAFVALWNSINTKRGYGWYTNPWVWIYEFEKISKEEAERLEGMK